VILRLWAALLLATIGFQAAAPDQSVERTAHSAFTASSREVALAPPWDDGPRLVAAPAPVPPHPINSFAERGVTEPQLPRLRPNAAGPPAIAILARQPGPRPPPSA